MGQHPARGGRHRTQRERGLDRGGRRQGGAGRRQAGTREACLDAGQHPAKQSRNGRAAAGHSRTGDCRGYGGGGPPHSAVYVTRWTSSVPSTLSWPVRLILSHSE